MRYEKTPTKQEIQDFMVGYNDDEVGIENSIDFDEAEKLLLDSDEYYYSTILRTRLNFIFEGEKDLMLLIEHKRGFDVRKMMNNMQEQLYKEMETDEYTYACELDYYQDKISKIDEINIIDEDIDDFINFYY